MENQDLPCNLPEGHKELHEAVDENGDIQTWAGHAKHESGQ